MQNSYSFQNMPKFFITLALLFFSIYSSAQEQNKSKLSIKEIMQGDAFVGHLPSDVQWDENGDAIYFKWNPESAFSDSLYTYNLKNNKIDQVSFEDTYNLPPQRVVYNADQSKKAYTNHGDLYLIDEGSKKITQITNTIERESNPHFTNNNTAIAYTKNNNLYVWDITSGITTQITNFTDKKEKDKKKDSKDEWLYNDQIALFDVLKTRKAKNDEAELLTKRTENKRPLEIFTDKKQITNLNLSPDGKFVTYLTVDRKKNKNTIVPHYVTESGYTEDQKTRSKVGDAPSEYKLYIYDIKGRHTYPVVLDNLEGLDYIPEYTKDYPDKPYENEDRISYISEPKWSSDGKHAVLDINANDYKDRWIVLLNLEKGTITNLNHQHDEAWIAGPGISSYGRSNLGWMPDNKNIWYMSEKTGYAHIYKTNISTKKTKALTSGTFEIYNPFISKDQSLWYFGANKNHPGDRQFYSMPIQGGKLKQLTEKTGRNDVTLSPDEQFMAILYSNSNTPTELYLKPNPQFNKSSESAKQITHSTTKAFNSYSWRTPENITYTASDGATVYAHVFQPKTEVKNNAAIVFVHGAGYLQNVHQWWSSYFREYMFHNLLVDNGYTVINIDYRGSAGYGRDWRTGIYRHMGGKDLSDQVDGVNYLVENYGIDKNKVGIYGGSYGGFITLMGMFNEADTFKAGAAIRSVGDWAAYNHGYTARILNTPTTDSLAYRKSSPIYFADGLKGDLLILHGMVDDNVHFQDMVRLSQRLIELEKHNWEMAIYPVERHGFVEPSSWTDEYTRIYNLFQKSLLGILPTD